MAEQGNVMKELDSLIRKADKLFDGQVEILLNEEQLELEEGEWSGEKFPEQIMKFFMAITPNSGLFKNARCMFRVLVHKQRYPVVPPAVQCLSKIYHPNIDFYDNENSQWEYSNVCVNILENDWQPEVGLDGCIMAVLYLLYYPNLDEPVCPMYYGFLDFVNYESLLPRALKGERINEVVFDKVLLENDDNERNADGNKLPVNVANNDVDDTVQDYHQSAYILPNGQLENKLVPGADVLLVKEGDPCNGLTNSSDSQPFTNVSPPLSDPHLSSVPCTDQGDSDHSDNTPSPPLSDPHLSSVPCTDQGDSDHTDITLSPPLSDPPLSSVPYTDQGDSDHTDNTLSPPLSDPPLSSVPCTDQGDNTERTKPAAAENGWFTKLKEGFTRTFWTFHDQKS